MKCPYCGLEIQKTEKNVIKNEIQGLGTRSYYHIKCHELAKTTPKNEWPEKKKQAKDKAGEIQLWAEIIYDYLLRYQRISPDFMLIKRQLDSFVNGKYGYKYKGVYLSVKYFYEIRNKSNNEDKSNGGIGIVPYVYEEAKYYWEDKARKDDKLVNDIEKQINELKNKEIKRVPYAQKKKKTKKNLSLSDVLGMEDE